MKRGEDGGEESGRKREERRGEVEGRGREEAHTWDHMNHKSTRSVSVT
jgi:hypothetical protein